MTEHPFREATDAEVEALVRSQVQEAGTHERLLVLAAIQCLIDKGVLTEAELTAQLTQLQEATVAAAIQTQGAQLKQAVWLERLLGRPAR